MPNSRVLLLSVELKTTVEIARPNAVPSWVSVWKRAPPTDCSWGRQARAMNSVPVEKEKSAPKTVMIAAGKPKAQYGAEGSIRAKSRFEVAVKRVPMAIMQQLAIRGVCVGNHKRRNVPARYTRLTRETMRAMTTLQLMPVTGMGSSRIIVRIGLRWRYSW